MKKWLHRVGIGFSLALITLLCLSYVVFAIPADVTDLHQTSMTSTSISLSWTKAASSNSTVVQYSTTGFPATHSSGINAYSGTLNSCTVTGLVAGQIYFFSAWGYDGSNYSAGYAIYTVSTPSTSASENTSAPFSPPTLPTAQNPDTSGWSWYPFNNIVDYFSDNASTHGGLGMPSANVMMFFAGIAVTGVGLLSYIKWRTFLASWFLVLVLTGLFSMMHIMQWMVFIFLIVVGAGVWAVEHNFQ